MFVLNVSGIKFFSFVIQNLLFKCIFFLSLRESVPCAEAERARQGEPVRHEGLEESQHRAEEEDH